jgi:hypothetical protein
MEIFIKNQIVIYLDMDVKNVVLYKVQIQENIIIKNL